MARANLRVNEALAAAFVAAQTSGGVRGLTVRLNVEGEALELVSSLPSTASPAADFPAFASSLGPEVLGLFCTDPQSASPTKHWIVVSFLPPGTKPLLKMISASSRADIRDQLGSNCFVGEFHASSADELTYAELMESQKRDAAEALSEMEKRIESEVRGAVCCMHRLPASVSSKPRCSCRIRASSSGFFILAHCDGCAGRCHRPRSLLRLPHILSLLTTTRVVSCLTHMGVRMRGFL